MTKSEREQASLSYQAVHSATATPLTSCQLKRLTEAFQALDDFAISVSDSDERLSEVANCLADSLRMFVSRLRGIDLQPVSELGPHDAVDLCHSLNVLMRLALAGESDRGVTTTTVGSAAAPSELNGVQDCLVDIENRMRRLVTSVIDVTNSHYDTTKVSRNPGECGDDEVQVQPWPGATNPPS